MEKAQWAIAIHVGAGNIKFKREKILKFKRAMFGALKEANGDPESLVEIVVKLEVSLSSKLNN